MYADHFVYVCVVEEWVVAMARMERFMSNLGLPKLEMIGLLQL